MTERKLFARKATGLVREIGMATAVIIAICNVVGLGWQKRVFQATGWTPLGESKFFLGIHPVVMAFLLAGIVMIISIYCFAMLSAAMPRSGGGYIFISRILNPALGFVATWLQFFAVAVSYGLISVATLEAVWLFGGLAGISLPAWLTSPWGLFMSGVVITVIFSGIASLGLKMTGRLLWIMFWIPAIVLAFIYILFITATPATMEAGVQALWGHSAAEYTQAAIDQGIADIAAKNTYWQAVASAILAAYWAYIGYGAASFVAGEVKEAHRTLPKAMFTSGVCIMLLYMTISTLMARAAMMAGRVGDFSLMSAMGFLNYGAGSFAEAGLPKIGGWMPMVAGIQMAGLGFARYFQLGLVLFAAFWVANDIPPFIITTSRMIFAMAFDRVLPGWLAEVNEKYHSPVNAIIFTSVISIIFGCAAEADLFGPGGISIPFLRLIISPAGAIAATDIWDLIFFTVVCLAAAYFPIRRPDIFEKSPFRLERTWTIVLGALATLGNLWLFWVVATHPHGWNLFGIKDLPSAMPFLFSLFLIVVGYLIYWYYSNKARRTGVELTTIFTEIPPD
ncbi:MAG TPA: APC family permease [Anaerolineae bacterium]|nr:APC family permease [Anaerolineae bacterium]